jgi:tetratricopeptide (TPR) repeat protein
MNTTRLVLVMPYILLWGINSSAQSHDIAVRAYELRMNGKPHEAILVLDSALAIYPDSAVLWFEKGRCLDWLKTEDCEKFIHVYTKMNPRIRHSKNCLKKACKLDPNNARYRYNMSEVQEVLALASIYTPWRWLCVRPLLKSSTKNAKLSVSLAPDSLLYRGNLINLVHFGWIAAGSKKAARLHADTLNAQNRIDGILAYELIANKRNPYDALSELKALLGEMPSDPRLLHEIATQYSRLDSNYRDSCITYCIKALELDSLYYPAIRNLTFKLPKSRKVEALPYIETYIASSVDNYLIYKAVGFRWKGVCLREMGRIEEAKASFAEAERLNPGSNESHARDLQMP